MFQNVQKAKADANFKECCLKHVNALDQQCIDANVCRYGINGYEVINLKKKLIITFYNLKIQFS